MRVVLIAVSNISYDTPESSVQSVLDEADGLLSFRCPCEAAAALPSRASALPVPTLALAVSFKMLITLESMLETDLLSMLQQQLRTRL